MPMAAPFPFADQTVSGRTIILPGSRAVLFVSSRRCRLSQGEHQAVRPVEEGRTVDDVQDLEVVEAGAAQVSNLLAAEFLWCLRQRGGGRNYGIPSAVDVHSIPFVEQALNIGTPLGILGRKPSMDGCAEDAAVHS